MEQRSGSTGRHLAGPLAGIVMSVALGVLAGCGSSGGSAVASLHSGAQASAGATASDLQKYQDVVVCARTHGLPDLPDAHLDDHGQPQFPTVPGGGKPPQSVLDGCKDLIARLPQSTATSQRPVLSAAALAKTRQFAACVRGKGYPGFPDPGPDGTFSVPAGSGASMPAKDSAAFTSCRYLLPNTGR